MRFFSKSDAVRGTCTDEAIVMTGAVDSHEYRIQMEKAAAAVSAVAAAGVGDVNEISINIVVGSGVEGIIGFVDVGGDEAGASCWASDRIMLVVAVKEMVY